MTRTEFLSISAFLRFYRENKDCWLQRTGTIPLISEYNISVLVVALYFYAIIIYKLNLYNGFYKWISKI